MSVDLGRLISLLFCVAWTSLSTMVLAEECEDYLVSPDLINFTEHPKNGLQSGSLQCKAQVTPIGGFNITWRSMSVNRITYGDKKEWISYQICWEFRSLDNSTVETWCPSEDRVTQSEERSSTIIKLTSTLNTSVTTHNRGSYRCYVEDWGGRLGYYSYSLKDGISANISPWAPNISSTQYIKNEGDDDSPTLYCHPDNSSGNFEWFFNGSSLNHHQDALKANNSGVYTCHTSKGNTTFSTIYRVLPFGCVNPVVDLEYPKLTIPEVQNESDAVAYLNFCWKPPSHLGGLDKNHVGYKVILEPVNASHDGKTQPTTNYSWSDDGRICYTGTFSNFVDELKSYSYFCNGAYKNNLMFMIINIKVFAVVNLTNGQNWTSLATQFPETSVVSWLKLKFNKTCNGRSMTLDIKPFGLGLLENTFTDTYGILYPYKNSTAHLYEPNIEYFKMLTSYYDKHAYGNEVINGRSKSFKLTDQTSATKKLGLSTHTFTSNGTILLVYSFGLRAKLQDNCVRRPQHVGPKDYYTCDIPSSPENLTPYNVSSTSVSLKWDEAKVTNSTYSPVEYYIIEIREASMSNNASWKEKSSNEELEIVIDGLSPYTMYFFRVYAQNSDGQGDYSEELNVTTNESIPRAPENLTIRSVTFTSIIVTWYPPAIPNGNISIYQVQIAISNPNESTTVKKITEENVTMTMFTTCELMPSTTYEVTVKAFTGAGSGPGANESVTTKELREPENLTIVNTTFNSITVTWKPPANSNGEVLNYRIQVVNINTPNSLVTLENTTETVSGLMPSTRYKVTVKAFIGARSGPGVSIYATTEEIDVKPLWIAGGAVISITVALVLMCFGVVYTSKCVKEKRVDLTLRKDLTLKHSNYLEFYTEIAPDQDTLFEVNATITYFEANESISNVPYTSEQISDEEYLPSSGDVGGGYVPAPISSPKETRPSTEGPTITEGPTSTEGPTTTEGPTSTERATSTEGSTTTERNTLDMDLEVSFLLPSIPASSAGYVPHPSPILAGEINQTNGYVPDPFSTATHN